MRKEKLSDFELQIVDSEIVTWLKDYVKSTAINIEHPLYSIKRSGVKGFVVGVSGGIDSAVVSTLCAKTGLPILCLEMPIHQNPSHVSRAENHINWLKERFSNVSSERVDLTSSFDEFCNSISSEGFDSNGSNELAKSNTRSRLRMIALYYHATLNGFVVCGTGNKVEDFGVGFYTKYGDGGVDISPIADLTKTQVGQLAEFLEINEEIIKATPSDGLWEDSRSDEEQIGATYKQLEWAMEVDNSPSDITTFRGDLFENMAEQIKVYEIFKTRNLLNRHKMEPIPVCKISIL